MARGHFIVGTSHRLKPMWGWHKSFWPSRHSPNGIPHAPSNELSPAKQVKTPWGMAPVAKGLSICWGVPLRWTWPHVTYINCALFCTVAVSDAVSNSVSVLFQRIAIKSGNTPDCVCIICLQYISYYLFLCRVIIWTSPLTTTQSQPPSMNVRQLWSSLTSWTANQCQLVLSTR